MHRNPDILYKYKSLDNFKNFVDIILNNRLWASKYNDLNDPMEGQYIYKQGDIDFSLEDKLLQDKGELRICSLSRINNYELMWSHYTNGQRGVSIGVKIDPQKYTVKPIQYSGLHKINNQNYNDQSAIEILSHKLEVWNYEEEERVFVRTTHFVNLKIIEIITGRAMSNRDYSFVKKLVEKINSEILIYKAASIM